jgi:hypothetical protein
MLPLFPEVADKLRQEQQQVNHSQEQFAADMVFEVLSALLAALPLFPQVLDKLRQEQHQVKCSRELFAC